MASDESSCHYICSRGILKSCDFHSSNPKSSCHDDYGYLVNMVLERDKKMFNNMSIYVCSDLLHFFVNKVLPRIKHTFVLVTGDSDLCVPRETLSQEETFKLLNSPLLRKWFIQNTQVQDNDKIVQMPIGLDFHTISEGKTHIWKLPEEKSDPLDQEQILQDIITNNFETQNSFINRESKIYVNFTVSNDRFKQRQDSLNKINKELLVINQSFTPRTNNWKLMTKYAFVLSPTGVGLDCHRTWEALCLGCIPIVKMVNFTKLFEDLPVLIVEDWSDVTEELLQKTLVDFSKRQFNYSKLTLQYWRNQIKI